MKFGLTVASGGVDVNPCVLGAGEQAPSLVLVQRVIELDDGVERRRGEWRVRHRPRGRRLQRNRRDRSAILLINISLESDIPAADRKRRPAGRVGAR